MLNALKKTLKIAKKTKQNKTKHARYSKITSFEYWKHSTIFGLEK